MELAAVAARALELSPERRFPTATAMVTELRRIAGDRLAAPSDVAEFVQSIAGAKIASRRAPGCESGTRLRTVPPCGHPTSGVQEVPRARALPSITGTLPPPAFDAEQTELLAAGFVELDESELVTLPPSIPPPELRAELPVIPQAPALGAWASLVGVDPSAFSLPPVTEVTWPPAMRRPSRAVAAHPLDRAFLYEQRHSLVAAAALGAALALGVLQPLHRGAPELATAVTTAPLAAPARPSPVAPPELAPPAIVEATGPAPKSVNSEAPRAQRPRPAPKERTRRAPDTAAPAQVAVPPMFATVDVAPEFDRSAAMQALRDAGDKARACWTRAAAPSSVRVAVTFARTGSVTGAAVEGPLAATAPGACIEAKFRPLRIPAFRGSSLTVRKTISF